MKKITLKMSESTKYHIMKWLNIKEMELEFQTKLKHDLENYLQKSCLTEEEMNQIFNILGDCFIDIIHLMEYITNDDEHDAKDLIRQAYVINGDPIPYERPILKEKVKLTKKQRKELDDLNLPYSIKELEDEDDIDVGLHMTFADADYLGYLVKKTKDSKTEKLLELFKAEFMPEVPEEKVKELHVYFDNYDEDLLFMDEEGLHKVAGQKAKIEFLDGKKKVGYLGSDFKDEDDDECLGLFEAYDEAKGFYDYHIYKLKDLLRADVLFYPREDIDFGLEIKVRDIKKVVKGMTEKKGEKKKSKRPRHCSK